MEKNCKVTVICTAYNQESYITSALEGFILQQTDFPFEVLVHDDASTDGTAAIIRRYAAKYPDLIRPILQTENQFSKIGFNGLYHGLIQQAKGEYIAFCEGDDFWTAPDKLQKDCDYLDAHPECGLVWSQSKVKIEDRVQDRPSNHLPYPICGPNRESDFRQMLLENHVDTLTVCCRKHLLDGFYDLTKNQHWKLLDKAMWLYISRQAEIHRREEVTAVYRVLNNSAMARQTFASRDAFYHSCNDLCLFFARTYQPGAIPSVRRKGVLNLAKNAKAYGQYGMMIKYLLKLVRLCTNIKTIY